ncbi:EAL domain-containing protein [Myxococcota bacterium]|nr:EAL domain-containing protein [Myxococcota bacterium]
MKSDPARDAPLVVVIDDDTSLLRRAQFELLATGLRVVTAESGEEGLRAIERSRPDLVILDVNLPGLDGYATCRAIRSLPNRSDLSILMVTASDDLASIEEAFLAGATDFATKPIHWRLLRHRARFLVRAGLAFGRLQHLLSDLSRSERRLSDAQRLAHVGHWEWLIASQQMLFSDETFQILGYGPGAVAPSQPLLMAAIHPEDRASLEKALNVAIENTASFSLDHRICTPEGVVRFVHHQGVADADPMSNERRVIGTLQDITERRVTEERIRHLAFFDSLTSLPNRRMLLERLERTIRFATTENCQLALMFVDVDRFKWVNDSLGHAAGDELLTEVARRLVDSLRVEDGVFRPTSNDASRFLSRVGGDEFVVTLLLRNGPEAAVAVARRILSRVSEPIVLADKEIVVTASIGIAVCPGDAEDVESLMRQADAATYQSKANGRNRFTLYTADLSRAAERALTIQSGLRRAIESDGLTLDYQPQIDVRSGDPVGLEALVRWHSPDWGLLSPTDFIPIAEETGLIQSLGAWVLHRACRDCRAWQRGGHSDLGVAVNVSPLQLRRADIVEVVSNALSESGLSPHHLELELTESALLEQTSIVVENLEQLRRMGIRLALDDFGTGYASLSYLKRVEFDSIKIDRSFVRDICVDAGDRAIVSAIVAIGRTFDLRVVAEGVEDDEQLALRRREGCEIMQGYRLGRPAPIDQVLVGIRARADRDRGSSSSD